MSAIIVRFPRSRMVRPKYEQKAISALVRRFRGAHPGRSDRWYWNLVRAFRYSTHTLAECLSPTGDAVMDADSLTELHEAKRVPDKCEVVVLPPAGTQLSGGLLPPHIQRHPTREQSCAPKSSD